MAVTKSLFPTVAHAMALHKTRGVKMVGVRITVAKITGVASRAVTNNAVIIEAVKAVEAMKLAAEKTVVVRPVLATNVVGLLWPAASPEATAPETRGARATMVRSQQALVGTRML